MTKLEMPLVLILGFALDYVLGDPENLPHPVVFIGRLISFLEKLLLGETGHAGISKKAKVLRGLVLTLVVVALSFVLPFGILLLAGKVNFWLKFVLEIIFCWQILAARTLSKEGMMVYEKVKDNDLPGARKQVSRIVGRDTESLSLTDVIKACVETISESASDGVIAPLLFLAIGGIPLGFMYKSINTLDSMVGYKNERYIDFGAPSARLDDLANFIPARVTALLMIVSSKILGFDWKGAYRIWLRDSLKHASPNSGNPEAACAGALGLELGGDAYYFGVKHRKSSLGDFVREAEPEDIKKSIKLMYTTSVLGLIMSIGIAYVL